MGENLFNTFSFNVWSKNKEEEKKEQKNKKRRKKQVKELKTALKNKKISSQKSSVDMDAVMGALMMAGGTPGGGGGGGMPAFEGFEEEDSDDDDVLHEVKGMHARPGEAPRQTAPMDNHPQEMQEPSRPGGSGFSYNRPPQAQAHGQPKQPEPPPNTGFSYNRRPGEGGGYGGPPPNQYGGSRGHYR